MTEVRQMDPWRRRATGSEVATSRQADEASSRWMLPGTAKLRAALAPQLELRAQKTRQRGHQTLVP